MNQDSNLKTEHFLHRLVPRSPLWTFGLAGVCLLILLLVNVLFLPEALADYIPPEEVEISTPTYEANFSGFDPALGTYEYDVTWQGIGAAKLSVQIEREGLRYEIITKARTNSFIDIFYKLRYTATGLISAVDLLPLTTLIDHKENSRVKRTRLDFLPNGEIKSVHWRKGKGTKVLQFDPGNFMLDPFSAAFLARSLEWEEGQTREFDTFNGKTRYLISLTATDKEVMNVNGKDREVWVISPKVKKLTTNKPGSKLRAAKIYITADKRKEILRIVSSVFIGSVKTSLVSFTPSNQPIPGAHVAQAPAREKVTIK